MLNPDIKKLLVEQINKEFYSAYLYLAMSNYYADKNLSGFENWFFVQAQEERDHALLMRTYLINQGEFVSFSAIDSPKADFDSFKAPLLAALVHEQYVTASIYAIYTKAVEHKDYRTMQFLDWFVAEQGEEEKNVDNLIKQFDLYAGDSKGLYMLNSELAARMYAPPSLVL